MDTNAIAAVILWCFPRNMLHAKNSTCTGNRHRVEWKGHHYHYNIFFRLKLQTQHNRHRDSDKDLTIISWQEEIGFVWITTVQVCTGLPDVQHQTESILQNMSNGYPQGEFISIITWKDKRHDLSLYSLASPESLEHHVYNTVSKRSSFTYERRQV